MAMIATVSRAKACFLAASLCAAVLAVAAPGHAGIAQTGVPIRALVTTQDRTDNGIGTIFSSQGTFETADQIISSLAAPTINAGGDVAMRRVKG